MKTKKKGGEKPRKTSLPVVQQPPAPRQLGISVEEAVEEFRVRIDMIDRDFRHDPGMMRYREALIIGLAAMEDKFNL
jgi:hypothetical protein